MIELDITIDLKDKMETAEGHRLVNLIENIIRHSQWKDDIEDVSINYGCERMSEV